MAPIKYRPDIDGLRALAILPVLLFHAGVPGFSGGYVGVDVFFVISGFLMAKILFEDWRNGRIDFLSFYERRVRRLLPALFFLLAGVFLVGVFVLLPHELKRLGADSVSVILFGSNFPFWLRADYFDTAAQQNPLLHTWSLAVEEQFYIVFPLALWFAFKLKRPLALMALAALLSLSVAAYGAWNHPSATFYLLPTRAWELLVGAFVAAPILRPPTALLAQAAGVLGGASVLAPMFLYSDATPFPGLAAAPPCLGAAMLIWAGAQRHLVARLLAFTPLVWVGLISYSLYLWHWPIIVFGRLLVIDADTFAFRTAALALSFAAAWASWRFVERPFRRRSVAATRARAFWSAGASAMVGVVLAAAVVLADGLSFRIPAQAQAIEAAALADMATFEASSICPSAPNLGRDLHACALGRGPARIVVLGDSHGLAIAPELDRIMREEGVGGVLMAVKGCAPVFGLERVDPGWDCAQAAEVMRNYIARVRPEGVLIVGSWRGALHEKDTVFRGRSSSDDESRGRNVSDALAATVAELHADGARVGLLFPTPGARADVPTTLARADWLNTAGDIERRRSEVEADFRVLREAAAEDGVDFTADLADSFCQAGSCAVADGSGRPYYVDAGHLNALGAHRAEPQLRGLLRALATESGR